MIQRKKREPDEMKKNQNTIDNWEKTTLKKVLDKSQERQKVFTTESGIPVKRLYRRISLHKRGLSNHVSWPPLDHETVCRFWDSGGYKQKVSLSFRTWDAWVISCL
jgi:D-hexose-6-phosphate mutarotase